jgi:hypothetical protein
VQRAGVDVYQRQVFGQLARPAQLMHAGRPQASALGSQHGWDRRRPGLHGVAPAKEVKPMNPGRSLLGRLQRFLKVAMHEPVGRRPAQAELREAQHAGQRIAEVMDQARSDGSRLL